MLNAAIPTVEQLYFKQELLSDEKTMEYNKAFGGCIDFPKYKWKSWHKRWINQPDKFYAYLYNSNEGFVGEIAYHLDEENHYLADIIVHSNYRGKGYGIEGLQLLCSIAKSSNVDVLYDNIAIDNPSVKLFLKLGFVEQYRTKDYIVVAKKL
ncbi:MAG: GNAT family N-acetyltransferase [Oscillospiraceae bacterium]